MQRTISRVSVVAALAFLLAACVTINIYFPAAAAEKAADKIIDDVWQLKKSQEKGQSESSPAVPPQTPAQPQK